MGRRLVVCICRLRYHLYSRFLRPKSSRLLTNPSEFGRESLSPSLSWTICPCSSSRHLHPLDQDEELLSLLRLHLRPLRKCLIRLRCSNFRHPPSVVFHMRLVRSSCS